ncbi:MAG: hypothetical protein LBK76_04585 [Verrucomicrobiales bacterium]|jgi:hypothetical protein|nr:hypothetical protein [Verrucomicrobiales bacterium]
MKKSFLLVVMLTLTAAALPAQTTQDELNRLRAENARLKKELTGAQPVERVWTLVGMWSGDVDRNTESFTVTADEWTIAWSWRNAGYFGIIVHDEYGKKKLLPVNTIGRTVSETIMRGAGTYYLEIMNLPGYGTPERERYWEVVVTANEPKPGGAVLDADTMRRIYRAAQIKRWHAESRKVSFHNSQLPTWWALESFAKKAVALPPVENGYRDWLRDFIELCRVKEGPRHQDAQKLLRELHEQASFWGLDADH